MQVNMQQKYEALSHQHAASLRAGRKASLASISLAAPALADVVFMLLQSCQQGNMQLEVLRFEALSHQHAASLLCKSRAVAFPCGAGRRTGRPSVSLATPAFVDEIIMLLQTCKSTCISKYEALSHQHGASLLYEKRAVAVPSRAGSRPSLASISLGAAAFAYEFVMLQQPCQQVNMRLEVLRLEALSHQHAASLCKSRAVAVPSRAGSRPSLASISLAAPALAGETIMLLQSCQQVNTQLEV